MREKLTSEQCRVVDRLGEIVGPRGATTYWVGRGTYARHTYPILRALARRGIVENIRLPQYYWPEWRLTDLGRTALKEASSHAD